MKSPFLRVMFHVDGKVNANETVYGNLASRSK